MQKTENNEQFGIKIKSCKKPVEEEGSEPIDKEEVSAGLRNLIIWVVTAVVAIGAAFMLDLGGGFGKIIFFAIAYAVWIILHKFFDR